MEYAPIWGFKSCLCGVEHGRRRSQEEAGRPSEDGEKQQRAGGRGMGRTGSLSEYEAEGPTFLVLGN